MQVLIHNKWEETLITKGSLLYFHFYCCNKRLVYSMMGNKVEVEGESHDTIYT